MRASAFTFVVALCFASISLGSSDRLVVHEWGTFTSLQDENGRAIGGLNTDDEPLPGFVHDLMRGRPSIASLLSKGLPRGPRDEITMRLETPVLYFHPPRGKAVGPVDVSVQFNGGLLSQFYPDAVTNLGTKGPIPTITDKTIGSLAWNGVRIGTNTAGPETDSHVWLAPRRVDAADITACNGESERYLFYRGVGHLDAPIVSKQANGRLTLAGRGDFTSRKLWLAQFAADGSCQAIELNDLGASPASLSMALDQNDRPVLDLPQLRAAMKVALVEDGLFDDEAEAMLCTWERSYFRASGLRLFYLVPRAWTDRVLPLTLSVDAKIERVMIGRLEILCPEQRIAMKELAGMKNVSQQMKRAWDLYSSLGRFRTALVFDANARQSTRGLRQMINLYGS